MIPEEVAIIAEELEKHIDADWDKCVDIAYKIYNTLNLCKCN